MGCPWASLAVLVGVLWLSRVPSAVPGRSSGVPRIPLGVFGGSLGGAGSPGRSRELLRRKPEGPENIKFSLGVCRGSREPLGVCLSSGSGPRDRHAK